MSNFEYNTSSANSDERVMFTTENPTPDEVKAKMEGIKCNFFYFKDSPGMTGLGFNSSSVKVGLPSALQRQGPTGQPEIIPSIMKLMIGPTGPTGGDLVNITYHSNTGGPTGSYNYKMDVVSGSGTTFSAGTTYRFIMSQCPFVDVSIGGTGNAILDSINNAGSTGAKVQILLDNSLKQSAYPEVIYDLQPDISGGDVSFTFGVTGPLGVTGPNPPLPFNEILLYGEHTDNFALVDKDKIFALHHLAINNILNRIG